MTLGWGDVLFWVAIAAGVITGGLTVYMVIEVLIKTRQPLPALDRTARTASVVRNVSDGESRTLLLHCLGADGEAYNAQLADYIDDSWGEAFASGSEWWKSRLGHSRKRVPLGRNRRGHCKALSHL